MLTSHAISWRARTRREWLWLLSYEVAVLVVMFCLCGLLERHFIGRGGGYFWIPDTKFGYSAESLHELLRSFGVEGRLVYVGIAFFDIFAYMHGYFFILISLMQWCSSTTSTANNHTSLQIQITSSTSNLVWVTWSTDLIENLAHIYCTASFDADGPNQLWDFVAYIGSLFNRAKWATFGVNLIILAMFSTQKFFASGTRTKAK